MTERTVTSRWDGDLRAIVDAGGFELVVDEPVTVNGGTGRGPQPTELLLASVASCFTIAMAFVARKRDVRLAGLDVEVTGTYDGPQFSNIRVVVRTEEPTGAELNTLVAAAQRVCYVTRTLAAGPGIRFVTGAERPAGDLAQG